MEKGRNLKSVSHPFARLRRHLAFVSLGGLLAFSVGSLLAAELIPLRPDVEIEVSTPKKTPVDSGRLSLEEEVATASTLKIFSTGEMASSAGLRMPQASNDLTLTGAVAKVENQRMASGKAPSPPKVFSFKWVGGLVLAAMVFFGLFTFLQRQ